MNDIRLCVGVAHAALEVSVGGGDAHLALLQQPRAQTCVRQMSALFIVSSACVCEAVYYANLF